MAQDTSSLRVLFIGPDPALWAKEDAIRISYGSLLIFLLLIDVVRLRQILELAPEADSLRRSFELPEELVVDPVLERDFVPIHEYPMEKIEEFPLAECDAGLLRLGIVPLEVIRSVLPLVLRVIDMSHAIMPPHGSSCSP